MAITKSNQFKTRSQLPIVLLLLTGISLTSCSKATEEIWIDVRTLEEFESGHIEQAFHIPHGEIANRISEVTSNKEAVIHLYCKSGGRAARAKSALEDIGFTHVLNNGDYEELKKTINPNEGL